MDLMLKIAKDPFIENQMILFSHVVICSLISKTHQLTEFNDFINEISRKLDLKAFKGKMLLNNYIPVKPCYKFENNCAEDFNLTRPLPNLTAFTGLFGVIFGIAVLYSIKNR